MIFKTITTDLDGTINKITILNNSLANLKNSITIKNNTGTINYGIRGLLNSLSPLMTTKDLANIREYNRLVGEEGVSSQTAWYRTMLSSSKAAQSLFDDEKNLVKSGNSLLLCQKAITEATNKMTLSAKASRIALQALATIGNMLTFTLLIKGIEYIVTKINNWIHSLDIAKKELDEANNDLKAVNSELETTASRIDELNAKENLSLIESEELENLKAANIELERELRIKKELANTKSEKANKEALLYFDKTSGSFSDSLWAQLKEDITSGDILTRSSVFSAFDSRYLNKISEAANYIEQAEELRQTLAEITDTESKEYKDTSASLEKTETMLAEMISEFMEKDDLLMEGMDNGLLASLDALYEKYDIYTNGRAYVVENKLSSILSKVDFKDNAKELEQLGKDGALSLDTLTAKFPCLISYLDEAGISAEELYQYIMALSNPDAINYKETRRQLLEAVGIKDGEINGASDEKVFNKLQTAGVLTNKGLEAYLKVRARYNTSEFDVNDLIYYIQSELKDHRITVDTVLDIPSTINQLNTRLKPAFDSLKSAYNDIFTDNGEFALDSIDIISTCDSIKSKLDDMAELGLSVDYASFVDFVRVLRDSESTEMDVENAFNSLADSITHAALSGIEDFATTKAALEDLGVINNEIIAFDALIRNTEALKAAGFDLIAVSQMEKDEADQVIAAFAKETVAAENVSQAIQMLSFQKQLCCLQDMNTASEIANLRTLAENAGYTGEVIRYLTELEQIYQDIAEGTINQNLINSKLRRAENLQALIREATAKVNYKPLEKSAVKAAAKAGAAAGKSYSDALKDELSNLNNVIGYIGDIIGRQINLLEDQKEAAVEALEAEKEAAEEALEAEKKLLQEKLDAKQAEIDKIEDSAKARKEEIDLQKAQYDLARMQNQRTILQYTEGKGMHYVTDTKEIRQAKEAVTEAAETIKISGMQKEITEFQSAIDGLDQRIEESNQHYDTLIRQTEKYWDSLIKGLDDYKSRWQELSGIEEKAKMEEALGNLGITTDHILDMSETALESFKSNYLNLLREMYSGNQDMLNLLQEFSGISTDTLLPLAGNIGSIAENLYGTAKTADSITENLYGAAKTADGITENLYGAAKAADGITENLTGSGNVTIETLLPPYDPDKDPTNFKEIYRKWNAHMADIENITDFLYSNINYPFNRQIQDTMNQLNNYTNIINNRNAPPVITQNITLNCPNVTNTSGVEYLQRELGHLSLMARQEPLRRY